MIAFVEILRAIATAFVANSHFKGVYPYDFFSFGGGFGLALFYMISGYLLADINEHTHFSNWYLKKIFRLYIPLLLFRIVEVGSGFLQLDTVKKAIMYLIFPASWFVASMVILYPLYFLFVKYLYQRYEEKSLKIGFIVFAVAFVALSITKLPIAMFSLQSLAIEEKFSIETPYLITQFIWMSCMLLGLYIRKNMAIKKIKRSVSVLYLGLSIFGVVLFLVVRLLTANGANVNIEILLVPAYMGFAYFLFTFFMGYEHVCKKFLNSILGKIVVIVSKCSLEIYYVQFIWVKNLKDIMFPLNLVLLVIAIVLTAWLLHMVSNFLYMNLTGGSKKND